MLSPEGLQSGSSQSVKPSKSSLLKVAIEPSKPSTFFLTTLVEPPTEGCALAQLSGET